MAKLLTEFDDFPEEGKLIGRLVTSYGEIEFSLMNCLAAALGYDIGTAMAVFFRTRGEDARINVADALIRPALKETKLDGHWSNAVGIVKHCKKIRNQFAHSHWWADTNGLFFLDFDTDAQKSIEAPVTFYGLDVPLLQQQERYFEHAVDWLLYLESEHSRRAGLSPSLKRPIPSAVEKPPLHNQREIHRPPADEGGDTTPKVDPLEH